MQRVTTFCSSTATSQLYKTTGSWLYYGDKLWLVILFTTRYRVGSFSFRERGDEMMVGSLRFWYIYAPTQNIWNQILKSLGLRQHDKPTFVGP